MRKKELAPDSDARKEKEPPAAQPELFEGGGDQSAAASASNLDALAAALREAHEQVEAHVRSALEHAIAAGGLLLQVKAELPHGQWLPWLTKNVPRMSARSAQVYMQLAKHARSFPDKYADSAHLSIDAALASFTESHLLPRLEAEAPLPDAAQNVTRIFAMYVDATHDLLEQNRHASHLAREGRWSEMVLDPADGAYARVKALCPVLRAAFDELDAAVDSGIVSRIDALRVYADIARSYAPEENVIAARIYAEVIVGAGLSEIDKDKASGASSVAVKDVPGLLEKIAENDEPRYALSASVDADGEHYEIEIGEATLIDIEFTMALLKQGDARAEAAAAHGRKPSAP